MTSADGTRFAGYTASPAGGSRSAFVIMPDVRGLHAFYKDLAVRFAEAGQHAIAIDYFGRTAGVGAREDGFDYKPHVERMDYAKVDEDVAAAVAWLRNNAGAETIFTIGFCMGGAMSWRQSAAGHDLAGCVGLYGIPSRAADRIADMRAPLLLLAAGQDFTPVAEVEKFADEVRAAGAPAELKVYPDAPHSFFDRGYAQFQQECADAWRMILDFAAAHAAR